MGPATRQLEVVDRYRGRIKAGARVPAPLPAADLGEDDHTANDRHAVPVYIEDGAPGGSCFDG